MASSLLAHLRLPPSSLTGACESMGMGSFIIRVLINGLALWVATWLLQGMDISTSATESAAANAGLTQGGQTPPASFWRICSSA